MAVLALLIAVSAFVLSRGPVPIDALTPAIEDELGRRLGGMTVTVEKAYLEWKAGQRALYVSVRDARFRESSGREVARFPRLKLAVSGRALLRGKLAPVRVELNGARAVLIRSAEGRISLGFGRNRPQDGQERPPLLDSDPLDLLVNLLSGEQGDGSGGESWRFLTDIVISDANLTFFDAASQTLLRAPEATLAFTRRPHGIQALLRTDLDIGGVPWRIALEANYRTLERTAEVDFEFEEMRLSRLAATIPFLRALRDVDVPLQGRAHLAINTNGEIASADLNLKAGSGHLSVPGLFAERVAVDSAIVAGVFDPDTGALELRRLQYLADRNRATFKGAAKLDFEPGTLRLSSMDLDLDGRDMSINVPSMSGGTAKFDHVTFRGRMEADENRLGVEMFQLADGSATIFMRGNYAWGGATPALYLEGGFTNLRLNQLLMLWPVNAGSGAREWVADHMREGILTRAEFTLDAPEGTFGRGYLPNEALKLEFQVRDLVTTYIRGLPPITGVHGRGLLEGDRFVMEELEGTVGDVRVTGGRVFIDELHVTGTDGTIDAVLQGPVSTILDLLDRGPFGYPSRYGIDPHSVGGQGGVRLQVTLPMRKSIDVADVEFAAAANIENLSVPRVIRGMDLTEGDVLLQVNGAGLTGKGDVLLNGIASDVRWQEVFDGSQADPSTFEVKATLDGPARRRLGFDLSRYLSGSMELDLKATGRAARIRKLDVGVDLRDAAVHVPGATWVKPAGSGAAMRMTVAYPEEGGLHARNIALDGEDIAVRGELRIAEDGRLLSAEFPGAKVGTLMEVSAHAERSESGRLELAVAGDRLDIGPVLEAFDVAGGTGGGAAAQRRTRRSGEGYTVSVQLRQLGLARGVDLNDITFALAHDGRRFVDFQVSGLFDDDHLLTGSITGEPGAVRTVQLYTADAGNLLRGVLGWNSIYGGKLDLRVRLDDAKARNDMPPLSGRIEASDFRVVNAPVLARLLTIGSLTGLSELLQGAGIGFDRLDLKVSSDGRNLALEDGRAFGPSLGITLEGTMDRMSFMTDVHGTIVPAYSVNTALGRIPLLGNLFVGRKGEGIIGITYRIVGVGGKSEIFVNPLSALAPGFLRRLFELNGPSDERRVLPDDADVPGFEDEGLAPGGKGNVMDPETPPEDKSGTKTSRKER
ncbi:MAG: DUF3971 domain-containing protein [Alphaproteobacteria bacterium]